MRFSAICLIICSLMAAQKAAALEICGDLKQGELLLVKDKKSWQITFFNNLKERKYYPNEEGVFLAALHRDAPQKFKIGIYGAGKSVVYKDLQIEPTKWDIQRINGVQQHKVTPNKEHQTEIDRERADLNQVLALKTEADYWQSGFMQPVEGRISGNFGKQRIFNGIPKSPHSGTDIAAAAGTPVRASADGIVVLSGKDYFYTGNMVIIDHGRGLQTIYAHLQEAKVTEGQGVKKGEVIGLVGSTGRANGAHLHWGASLNGVRFNPRSLLNINEKKCFKLDSKAEGK